MPATTLYTIACEMLRDTNPYKKDISELAYKFEGQPISFLNILNGNLAAYRAGVRNRSQSNLLIAFNAISSSMRKYINDFPSSFAYKQKTKEKFEKWLVQIKEKYNIEGAKIPPELMISRNERDTAIVMVKELQSRDRKSIKQLCEIFKFDERSVQKNLRKLSPSLYEGERMGSEYEPFRVGGQPINVKISMIEEEDKTRYYWTPNTLHPLVLQENLLQVETLLKSLSLNSDQCNSDISTFIALDIWSQLSEYAKEKLRKRFEFEEKIHQDFLSMLDERDFPDENIGAYLTQRDMIEQIDATISDILRDAEKIQNRKYSIKYKDQSGQIHLVCGVSITRKNHLDYVAIDENGREYLFREEWLNNIKID